MFSYATYLKKFGQVGSVVGVSSAYVSVDGLPHVGMRELIMFENKALGLIAQVDPDRAAVLHLDGELPGLGVRATLTREQLQVGVGMGLLGSVLDGLGRLRSGGSRKGEVTGKMPVEASPVALSRRRPLTQAFVTGVGVVDMLVPLAKGQRELVIGDRKTGKTQFVRQAMLSHVLQGGVAIYGGIGRRSAEVRELTSFFRSRGMLDRLVRVISLATDPTAACYVTPYTAMAVAEWFRDQGAAVLVVLDDLTLHAKYCRELALLSRQQPGRNAYPGDIFFAHSRLMERAGVFETGSITCLPIADTVLGDLSSYIQTNLMSMTDGHIYFDRELHNQGIRPPVNVFLSVSRVGRQTQTPLLRSISRELLKFLTEYERLQKLVHFGGELSGDVKLGLKLGEQLHIFFDQSDELIVPLSVNAVCLASIWAEMWQGYTREQMRQRVRDLVKTYHGDETQKTMMDRMLGQYTDFFQLTDAVKRLPDLVLGKQ